MTRGAAPRDKRRKLHASVQGFVRLLMLGFLIISAGALYVYYAANYSGKLVLAQQANAAEIVRGIDFGPVYLVQGVPGRYFITATLPDVDSDYWQTEFEVLDERMTPVFSQDELLIIGSYDFTVGKRESVVKNFNFDKGTGYYYFRYRTVNGVYDTDPSAPPVVEFAIRSGVITGVVMWLPGVVCLLLGVLCFIGAVTKLQQISTERSTAADRNATMVKIPGASSRDTCSGPEK